VSDEARGYLTELEPLVEKHPLQKLYLYYYLILRIERASVHDHEGTADVCRKAIKYFEGRFATTNVLLAGFAYTLIASLTMLGQYDEAEEWAEYSENLTDDGVPNWFKGLEQQIVLQFHKQDYPAAFTVYQKATSHKHFGHLATIEQQTWKLHEAYIQLLIAAGKIKPTEAERKKSGFRPTKFLNEVPEFAKDKRGMNIPVLMVHGIFLLYLKRYDDAYDRFLALDKYADRNLKEGDDAFRSFCFIKALLQIQKADFKRKDSEGKAADWIRRMSTQPVMLTDAPHEVENIPYDHLWAMAMEALEREGGVKLGD
jgi:tetratricopeptide (TPR) repeat protein